MNDQNTIIELSKMSLGAFIKKLNSMTSEEQKELLNNPYLDELNPVIFSSFFLQLQPEEAKQILNNPKIYHKVLTSPKNKKKRNILNIVGENNFDLLKHIFESDYFSSYKEQFYDYIDSISYESFQKILESVNLTKITDAIFKEKSVEELENLTGIGNLNPEITTSFLQKVKTHQLNPLGKK